MFEHPVLRTLLCAKCREFYGDGTFEQGTYCCYLYLKSSIKFHIFINQILQVMMQQICFVDGVQMVVTYTVVPFVAIHFVTNVLKEILILY